MWKSWKKLDRIFFSVVLLYGQAVHQYSHIVPWLSVNYMYSFTTLQLERRNRSNLRECALLLRHTVVMMPLMQIVSQVCLHSFEVLELLSELVSELNVRDVES